METKLFSVRDSKAEIFHPPFHKKTHAEALRDFQSIVNTKDENNNINKYPEDYDLYYVGNYDDQTGKIDSLATPQHVEKAISLIKQ